MRLAPFQPCLPPECKVMSSHPHHKPHLHRQKPPARIPLQFQWQPPPLRQTMMHLRCQIPVHSLPPRLHHGACPWLESSHIHGVLREHALPPNRMCILQCPEQHQYPGIYWLRRPAASPHPKLCAFPLWTMLPPCGQPPHTRRYQIFVFQQLQMHCEGLHIEDERCCCPQFA